MEAMDELAGYLSPNSDNEDRSSVLPSANQPTASTTATSSSGIASPGVSRKEEVETSDSEDGEEESKSSGASNFRKVPATIPYKPAVAIAPKVQAQVPLADINQYKFIPLRLTEEERRMLNVLVNALEVCEYTDVVDVTFSHTRKSKYSRIIESLVDILSISSGLMVSLSDFLLHLNSFTRSFFLSLSLSLFLSFSLTLSLSLSIACQQSY